MYEGLEILVDGQPILKTRFMHRLGVNQPELNKILGRVERGGFVTIEEKKLKKRSRYRITITQDGVRLYRELGMLRRLRDA